MSTNENLKMAFAGESQANRRYLAFAKKAEEDGFKQIGKLFRAAADAETVHALNHLRAMKGVNDTKNNVEEAINGEIHEFMEMYPGMLKEAEKEGNQVAKTTFSHANQVEKIHAELYKKAAASLHEGKDLDEKEIHVCQICGNTFLGEVPDQCPICMAKKEMFKKIE